MALEQYIYGYIAREVRFEGGDYVIKEGSSGHWAYVVLEGQVKMKKTTPMGLVTIDTLKEGDVFGEISHGTPARGLDLNPSLRMVRLDWEFRITIRCSRIMRRFLRV